MNNKEFSEGFDTLVSSYRRFKDFDKQEMLDSIEFDEFEKSLYLTKAQEEIVISLYDGKNSFGDSFESTEEMRRSLDFLVETAHLGPDNISRSGDKSLEDIDFIDRCFILPEDVMFITLEQIIWNDSSLGCFNGKIVSVQPVTQDEYNKVRKNPFRGPTKYKALRLDPGYTTAAGRDSGTNIRVVEIVSKYQFDHYTVRYLRRPRPIILETLPNELTIEGINEATECELNPILHHKILERAVLMALRAKGINTDK